MRDIDSNRRAEQDTGGKDGQPPQTGPMVSITIDGKVLTIHRGRQTVLALKELAGVPLVYELAQVDNGLQPLPDDGAVTIKGDEKFIAYPRDSASS